LLPGAMASEHALLLGAEALVNALLLGAVASERLSEYALLLGAMASENVLLLGVVLAWESKTRKLRQSPTSWCKGKYCGSPFLH
jgi:hypothetical protein